MRFFSSRKKLLPSILTIIIALSLSLPVSANIGDWGMVQNFNKKGELAKQGDVKAMYDLGKLYERGRGTNKNMIKAAEWFQQAATAGHAGAQARLGILYFEGRGINQDYQKAIKLLNAAAKQNVPSAFFQLANMFELGTGVRQDLHQSIFWYKKAKASGYYLAEGKIERLQKRLDNGEVNIPASSQTASKQMNTSSPLIEIILQGRWLKRKTAVGYLPSNIANCAKDSHNSITCISTSQERSTGTEVITYNTESVVTTNNNQSFNVTYTNNVLDVALIATEDGNGQAITQSTSRIKKGKQGKQRKLSCTLKNNKTITCSKGASSFNLVSP